jgi:hypothetical protein
MALTAPVSRMLVNWQQLCGRLRVILHLAQAAGRERAGNSNSRVGRGGQAVPGQPELGVKPKVLSMVQGSTASRVSPWSTPSGSTSSQLLGHSLEQMQCWVDHGCSCMGHPPPGSPGGHTPRWLLHQVSMCKPRNISGSFAPAEVLGQHRRGACTGWRFMCSQLFSYLA